MLYLTEFCLRRAPLTSSRKRCCTLDNGRLAAPNFDIAAIRRGRNAVAISPIALEAGSRRMARLYVSRPEIHPLKVSFLKARTRREFNDKRKPTQGTLCERNAFARTPPILVHAAKLRCK